MTINTFNLQPGRILARKYEVLNQLGRGWEGEVYKIREINSGIDRAAKLFFPQRNLKNKAVRFYARKLHKLRSCAMVIQYHTEEMITFKSQPVTVLVSEFVDGILLTDFISKLQGKRLNPFQGLHLLYALAKGLEEIHQLGDYHGDLHADNIIVQRYGLNFQLRLLDMFYWGQPRAQNIHDDTIDLIRIFYDSLGGQKYYVNQPIAVKKICCGLKRSLILKKFKTAGQLRAYIEALEWE